MAAFLSKIRSLGWTREHSVFVQNHSPHKNVLHPPPPPHGPLNVLVFHDVLSRVSWFQSTHWQSSKRILQLNRRSSLIRCFIMSNFRLISFFFFFARERFLEQSYSLSYSKKRPAKVVMMVLVVLVLVVGLALVAAPVLLVAVIERWRHINVGVLNEWLTSTGDGMVRKPFYYSCSHTSHSMEMLKTKQMSEVDSKTHREKESDREKEREREKGGGERGRERGGERERGRERGRERERERERER